MQRKGCRTSCDVSKAAEGLENELWRRWRDEGLENEPHSPTLTLLHLLHSSFSNPSAAYPRHSSFSNPSAGLPTSQLVLQPFRCITYVIDASPMSQLILQPFRSFIYVTGHSTTSRCLTYVTGNSRTSPGESPMHRGMKNSLWWTSFLQQVTKFRSSYSFG